MEEIFAVLAFLINIVPHWVKAIFQAIETPLIMTIGFAAFFRFVMMPVIELWLDCKDHNDVSVNKMNGNYFLTKEKINKRKRTLLDGEVIPECYKKIAEKVAKAEKSS